MNKRQLTLELWYRLQSDPDFMSELRRALSDLEKGLEEDISWEDVKRQLWPQGESSNG